MSLSNWVQNTLKAAAEYIKRDKVPVVTIRQKSIDRLPKQKFSKDALKTKKKPKARKKLSQAKKLKKAA